MAKPSRRLLRSGIVLVTLLAIAFAVLAPPEHCPSASAVELRASAGAAVDWFVRNQEDDGRWLYEYNRDEDDPSSSGYNPVRHSGVTMGLYQAAGEDLPGALASADRGTEWARDQLIERGDWTAIEYNGEVETGSSALLAAGLVLRRDATGDPRHDGLLRRLGRFLLGQIEPSGAVLASYDPDTGAPVPGEHSKYFTGEAYMALMRLDRTFPAEGWGEEAGRIGDYLATERDEVEGHWPPIPDHWAAYGTAEEAARAAEGGAPDLSPEQVSYARRQAELFGASTRWVSQQAGPWGELVRGENIPRGGGFGVMDEALTGWWRTAGAEPRLAELQEPLAARASCVAGLAIRDQSDGDDAAGAVSPERVEGAWFDGGETRMDDQQHALSGLLLTIPIAQATEVGPSSSDGAAPSAWLWALALLLALNPARAAFGIPRQGRSRRDVAELAAGGGAIAGLAVCGVAAIASPLLDALDVSDPSFRAAAGIVAVLAGVADVFRRPPGPEPALPGRRAALIPVAFPVVARPALVVLALGAGADHGVLVVAATMALAVALMTALVTRCEAEGPSGRVLRWAGRLLSVGLVAAGVLLTLDGILDV